MTSILLAMHLTTAIVLDGSTTRAEFTGNEIPFATVGTPWTFTVLDADTIAQANLAPSILGRVRVGTHVSTHTWFNNLTSFNFDTAPFHGHVELDIGPEWSLLLEPETGPSGFDVAGDVHRITENVTLPEISSSIVWIVLLIMAWSVRQRR